MDLILCCVIFKWITALTCYIWQESQIPEQWFLPLYSGRPNTMKPSWRNVIAMSYAIWFIKSDPDLAYIWEKEKSHSMSSVLFSFRIPDLPKKAEGKNWSQQRQGFGGTTPGCEVQYSESSHSTSDSKLQEKRQQHSDLNEQGSLALAREQQFFVSTLPRSCNEPRT